MISDALAPDLISRTVGYKIKGVDLREVSPNLPQRIAIIGEVNSANQLTYPVSATEITSAKQAGDLYGYGSPIHITARILFPVFGGGLSGIPVVVYPQAEGSAVAKVLTLTTVGTADKNVKHTLVIAGRTGIDGAGYKYDVVIGDTPATISVKQAAAVNAVLSSPVIATVVADELVLTSKWKGLTSNAITVTVDTNLEDANLVYSSVSTTAGSGTPTIGTALTSFGDEWNTIVLNTYGVESDILDSLELFNGIADPETPTGRFAGQVMKPFVAITGSTADNNVSVTNARRNEMTIALAVAPLSAGLAMEAAANYTRLFAALEDSKPHLDIAGRLLPDMPTPLSIGTMADYNNRDTYVKAGNSTVTLSAGQYKVQDFVTTYHPLGEEVPQFRYPRNIMLDLNVYYGYYLMQNKYVLDHVIAADNDIVEVSNVIKPKTFKAILIGYAEELGKRGLIADVDYMKDNIIVGLSSTNPDRLETLFRYKRTGIARVLPTTAEVGFNFGTL